MQDGILRCMHLRIPDPCSLLQGQTEVLVAMWTPTYSSQACRMLLGPRSHWQLHHAASSCSFIMLRRLLIASHALP